MKKTSASSWNTRTVTFNYWFWFSWNIWNDNRQKKSSFLSPMEHFCSMGGIFFSEIRWVCGLKRSGIILIGRNIFQRNSMSLQT